MQLHRHPLWVCVAWVCVRTYICGYMGISGGWGSMLSVILYGFPPYLLIWDRMPHWTWSLSFWLPSKLSSKLPISACSHFLNTRVIDGCVDGCWRSKLKSSHLHNKDFTHWAMSPVPRKSCFHLLPCKDSEISHSMDLPSFSLPNSEVLCCVCFLS